MGRPNLLKKRKPEFLPILARVFAESGYSGATTAAIAQACELPENVLFRLWPSKKAMFIDTVDFVYENTVHIWTHVLESLPENADPLEYLLDYESKHIGEFGNFRVVFSGLGSSDDPQLKEAVRSLYHKFHKFLVKLFSRYVTPGKGELSLDALAWGFIGLGTVINIANDTGLLGPRSRKTVFAEVGRALLKNL